MSLNKILDTYCRPSLIYLGISVFGLIVIIVQNLILGNSKELCVGSMKCPFSHKFLLLGFKLLYIAFWTWFLNFLCRKGLTNLSWFLLLIPFLIAAILVAVLIYTTSHLEQKQQHSSQAHSH